MCHIAFVRSQGFHTLNEIIKIQYISAGKMNLNIQTTGANGGNLNFQTHQVTSPLDYKEQHKTNNQQSISSGGIYGNLNHSVNQQRVNQGTGPKARVKLSAPTPIDPLAKREEFAKSIRSQMRTSKIKIKRDQHAMEVANTTEVTLLSANCRGINSDTKQKHLEDLINEHRANMLALQETKLTRRLWIKGFTGSQTQLKRNGGCICATSLPGSKPIKSLNTSLTWTVTHIQGVPIHSFSIYIDPCDSKRANTTITNIKEIIDSLYRRTKTPRIILCGDLNQQRELLDTITAKWGLTPVLATGTATHDKGGALDQIYTNLKINKVRQLEINSKFSDHTPILCSLAFIKKQDDYIKHNDVGTRSQKRLSQAAASQPTADHLMKLDRITALPLTQFVESLVNPTKKIRRWYEGVKQTPTTIKADLDSYLDGSPGEDSWKLTMKKLEEHHAKGSWKQFYDIVGRITKLRAQCQPVQGLKLGDTEIYDKECIDKELLTYYQKTYEDPREQQPEDINMVEANNLFTTEDVEEAMKATNFSKGIGPDLFNGQVLNERPALRRKLANELRDLLNEGHLPQHLSDGRLVALSKKLGQSIVSLEDTRPIIIRSHISKIMEKTIKRKVETQSPYLFSTADAQSGFKGGRGTNYNIAKVLNMLHPGRGKHQNKSALLLIDLKKAFDTVCRNKLREVLISRCRNNIDRHLVSLISQLHSNNRIYIGQHSFLAKRGVAQGSVLAPLLFNIILEEALKSSPLLLQKYNHGSLLAFADDLIIKVVNQREAEKIISELEKLEKSWGLQLNKSKCQLIDTHNQIQLNGIPTTNTAKYLGFTLEADSSLQRRTTEAQIKRNLGAIKGKLRHINNDVKECLLNAYCKSLLHYFATPMRAARIWGYKQIEHLEKQLYREIHCLPRDINTQDLMHVTNHQSLAAGVICKNASNLATSIMRMAPLQLSTQQAHAQNDPTQRTAGPAKRHKIYLPKSISDTLLALTRGRTIVFFGNYHRCNKHHARVDDEHLRDCDLIDTDLDIKTLNHNIRRKNIHDWELEERIQIILKVTHLKIQLDNLVSKGEYTIVTRQQHLPHTEPLQEGNTSSPGEGSSPDASAKETTASPPEQKKRGRPRKSKQRQSGPRITDFYQVK